MNAETVDGCQVRRFGPAAGGSVTTTVTNPDAYDGTRVITFDVSRYQNGEFCVVTMNLTEGETQELIRNLVGSLNDFQRVTR